MRSRYPTPMKIPTFAASTMGQCNLHFTSMNAPITSNIRVSMLFILVLLLLHGWATDPQEYSIKDCIKVSTADKESNNTDQFGFKSSDQTCFDCSQYDTYLDQDVTTCGSKYNTICRYNKEVKKCQGFRITTAKKYDECTNLGRMYAFTKEEKCIDCSTLSQEECNKNVNCLYNNSMCTAQQARTRQTYKDCLEFGDQFGFDMYNQLQCSWCALYSAEDCYQPHCIVSPDKICVGRKIANYSGMIQCNSLGPQYQLQINTQLEKCIDCSNFTTNQACMDQLNCQFINNQCVPYKECYALCEQAKDQRTCESTTISYKWSPYFRDREVQPLACGWHDSRCQLQDCTDQKSNKTTFNGHECVCTGGQYGRCRNKLCSDIMVEKDCASVINDYLCQWNNVNKFCQQFAVRMLQCQDIREESLCSKGLNSLECTWNQQSCKPKQCETLFTTEADCYETKPQVRLLETKLCLWGDSLCRTVDFINCGNFTSQQQCVSKQVNLPDLTCVWQNQACRQKSCSDLVNCTMTIQPKGMVTYSTISGKKCYFDDTRQQCIEKNEFGRCEDLLSRTLCVISEWLISLICQWDESLHQCIELVCSDLDENMCVNSANIVTISNRTVFCDYNATCFAQVTKNTTCAQIKSPTLCNQPDIYKYTLNEEQCMWHETKLCEAVLCSNQRTPTDCANIKHMRDGYCLWKNEFCNFVNELNKCSMLNTTVKCNSEPGCKQVENKCIVEDCYNFPESYCLGDRQLGDKNITNDTATITVVPHKNVFCDFNSTSVPGFCYGLPLNMPCERIISEVLCKKTNISQYTGMHCTWDQGRCLATRCENLTSQEDCESRGLKALEPTNKPQQFLCQYNVTAQKCQYLTLGSRPPYCEHIIQERLCTNQSLSGYKCIWDRIVFDNRTKQYLGDSVDFVMVPEDQQYKPGYICRSDRCEYLLTACDCFAKPGCYYSYSYYPTQPGVCKPRVTCSQALDQSGCKTIKNCKWLDQSKSCVEYACQMRYSSAECNLNENCAWDWTYNRCILEKRLKNAPNETCEHLNSLQNEVQRKNLCKAKLECLWNRQTKLCFTNVYPSHIDHQITLPCDQIPSEYLCAINQLQCQWNPDQRLCMLPDKVVDRAIEEDSTQQQPKVNVGVEEISNGRRIIITSLVIVAMMFY